MNELSNFEEQLVLLQAHNDNNNKYSEQKVLKKGS